jgi:hypothetical protein
LNLTPSFISNAVSAKNSFKLKKKERPSKKFVQNARKDSAAKNKQNMTRLFKMTTFKSAADFVNVIIEIYFFQLYLRATRGDYNYAKKYVQD